MANTANSTGADITIEEIVETNRHRKLCQIRKINSSKDKNTAMEITTDEAVELIIVGKT